MTSLGKTLALLALTGSLLGYSQVPPAAHGGVTTLEGGAAYSYFNADYTTVKQHGLEAVADLNLTGRLGVEGEARWLEWHGSSSGIDKSSSYLIGPRVRLVNQWRAQGFVKLLVGDGSMTFLRPPGSGNFFAVAPGGTLDIRLTPNVMGRFDYEYEFWPNAPGAIGFPSHDHGLTPHGLSVGVVYRFWR